MDVHSITFPSDVKEIEILQFCDIHSGSPKFNYNAFKKHTQYVMGAPNRYVVCNGDLLNNSIKSSVGSVYEEVRPRDQRLGVVSLLTEIKDRILCVTSGNHCERTTREVDMDPAEDVAFRLGVPYFDFEVLLKIRLGENIAKKRPVYYTVYVTHGSGGGQTIGAKANRLEKLQYIVMSDVYLMGHTHQAITFPGVIYVPERQCDVVTERKMWFVNGSSFINRERYAKHKNMKPQHIGSPIVLLSGTEHKVEVINGRL